MQRTKQGQRIHFLHHEGALVLELELSKCYVWLGWTKSWVPSQYTINLVWQSTTVIPLPETWRQEYQKLKVIFVYIASCVFLFCFVCLLVCLFVCLFIRQTITSRGCRKCRSLRVAAENIKTCIPGQSPAASKMLNSSVTQHCTLGALQAKPKHYQYKILLRLIKAKEQACSCQKAVVCLYNTAQC